jgi:hypothetical protein
MLEMIDEKIKYAQYGKASKARDEVYQGGQGNITQARELALQQISLYKNPDIYFDLATMEVRSCFLLVASHTWKGERGFDS